jgi:hypothetical protein
MSAIRLSVLAISGGQRIEAFYDWRESRKEIPLEIFQSFLLSTTKGLSPTARQRHLESVG